MCITICSACRAEHIPTTAGIPDLLQMLVQLTQSRLAQRLMFINELQATVLEVRSVVLHQLFAQSPSWSTFVVHAPAATPCFSRAVTNNGRLRPKVQQHA